MNKYRVTWKSGKKEHPNLPDDWYPITTNIFIDAESKRQAFLDAVQKHNAVYPKVTRMHEDSK